MHPHSLELLKVDQLGFHLSFLKDCISGCRSPNEMGVTFTVFRHTNSLRVFSYYKLYYSLVFDNLFYECISFLIHPVLMYVFILYMDTNQQQSVR